ncbi:MAG: hypothetical protein NC409_05705 [Clostridium sp.]|nr:hypothetical protein [Clostridium sp.]
MASNEYIQISDTPRSLLMLGVKNLPIVMKQRTLSKCMREAKGSRSGHGLSRKLIEKIPVLIENPALIVDELDRGSYALIFDECDAGKRPLLLAIHLEQQIHGKKIHEIASFYGRERAGDYLQKKETVYIWNIEKAKHLSRFLGLQLPTAWTNLDFMCTITQKKGYVKEQNQKNS